MITNRVSLASVGLFLFAITLHSAPSAAQGNPNLIDRLTVIEGHGNGVALGFPTVVASNTAGTVKGDPFGIAEYTTVWVGDPKSVSVNQFGGECARGSGEVQLTTPSGDTLTLALAGTKCSPGIKTTLIKGTYVVNAAFVIIDGTGRFSSARGTGNVVLGLYPDLEAYLHIDGTIKLR